MNTIILSIFIGLLITLGTSLITTDPYPVCWKPDVGVIGNSGFPFRYANNPLPLLYPPAFRAIYHCPMLKLDYQFTLPNLLIRSENFILDLIIWSPIIFVVLYLINQYRFNFTRNKK